MPTHRGARPRDAPVGEKRPTEGEEGMGGRTERDVVMEASPGAPFEVIQAQLAFQLLIVALDPPAQLGEPRPRTKRRLRRQGREIARRGGGLSARPLAEEPHFGAGPRAFRVPVREAHPRGREAGGLQPARSLAPRHAAVREGRGHSWATVTAVVRRGGTRRGSGPPRLTAARGHGEARARRPRRRGSPWTREVIRESARRSGPPETP